MPDDDSFRELRALIQFRLDHLSLEVSKMAEDIGVIKSRVASLRTSTAIFGSLAGLVAGAVVSAVVAMLVGS